MEIRIYKEPEKESTYELSYTGSIDTVDDLMDKIVQPISNTIERS